MEKPSCFASSTSSSPARAGMCVMRHSIQGSWSCPWLGGRRTATNMPMVISLSILSTSTEAGLRRARESYGFGRAVMSLRK
eukprot:3502036-Pleurochrysis_carterae.AAC.1